VKLSTRVRYALQAMQVVARQTTDGALINLTGVADRSALSRRYLEQGFISLKNAGPLKAVTGKHDGHLLARPASDIHLTEIVEAASGPTNIVGCLACPDDCTQSPHCDCRNLYMLVNDRIRGAFSAFTLSDLAGEAFKSPASRCPAAACCGGGRPSGAWKQPDKEE